ncbi:MAG: flagellar capping protein FliD [Methylophilaceae bacterium]|jgi:flagellar capping protein FliD
MTTQTSNIDTAISNIVDEGDLSEIRLESLEKRYTAQFSNLNRVLAKLSSQQTFFSQAFGGNDS